jgi:hypothetical protein
MKRSRHLSRLRLLVGMTLVMASAPAAGPAQAVVPAHSPSRVIASQHLQVASGASLVCSMHHHH